MHRIRKAEPYDAVKISNPILEKVFLPIAASTDFGRPISDI